MSQINLPQIEIDNLIKLFTKGRIQEVIDKIQLLNTNYPNIPLLFNILGVCHKKLGDLALASQMFEKAISLKPDYAEAYYNLGTTLKHHDKLKNAVINFKKAIALFPDYPDAYNNLGNTLDELGQKKDAIKCYESLIAIRPDYAEAHYNLGTVHKKLGEFEEAKKSFKTALTIKPNYSEARHLLNGLIGFTSKAPPREYVKNLFDVSNMTFPSGVLPTTIPVITEFLFASTEIFTGDIVSLLEPKLSLPFQLDFVLNI